MNEEYDILAEEVIEVYQDIEREKYERKINARKIT